MGKRIKKERIPDVEVYSYLNIRNRNLGKWYKETGVSPLAEDFSLSEKMIHEALEIGQMKNKRFTIPFGAENKKYIKKKAETSIKNCNKTIINLPNIPYSKEFSKKFDAYLRMRMHLTKKLFENSKNQDFDEIAAFREIHNLDPVFADLLEFGEKEDEGLFAQKLDNQLSGLEKKYNTLYAKKLKEIELNNKKVKKQAEKRAELNLSKSKQAAAELQKKAEEHKKQENKKSAEKIRQEIKTANAENKAKKSKEKK